MSAIVFVILGAHGRLTRQRYATPLLAAGGLLLVAAGGGVLYLDTQRSTMFFRYEVAMTPDGSGTVRVSLPIPIVAAWGPNVAVTATNGSVETNRSGVEPAYDVTLTGPGTLTATFSAYRYLGPYDMTRAGSMQECSGGVPCNATISILVISGTATGVHIVARATWTHTCYFPSWTIDAVAQTGEREYPAAWPTVVC